MRLFIFALCAIFARTVTAAAKDTGYAFPENFKFGVATASYQIEGAWNEHGKGPNVWDTLTHRIPPFTDDASTGDIACDAYHKTVQDVQILKSMGVNFYRFSLSWSRLLPRGFSNYVNPEGVQYYNDLINELLANDITPIVTIFHWDTPQNLEELGGWPNPKMADFFVDYARVVFDAFGDRVKEWLTFNEPNQICQQGYATGGMAPAHNTKEMGGYWCTHTVLIAHGRAYRMYQEEFKSKQGGRVGITIDNQWNEPLTNSTEDKEAAERANIMNFGWYANAIFSKNGDYPSILRERVDQFSEEEGFTRSRLPYFTQEEIEMIRGSHDFFGLNHYTSRVVTNDDGDQGRPSHEHDVGTRGEIDPKWEPSAADWLYVVPWGLRKTLEWIKENYDNPEVIITENGYADKHDAPLRDCERVKYYNLYLEEVLKAIHESNCNVTAYTAWSFMDNFEWQRGYTQRYGLYHVDFEDPERPRTPKMSAHVFANIIKTKRIDWDFTPKEFEKCEW